jgi:hypothetical protein
MSWRDAPWQQRWLWCTLSDRSSALSLRPAPQQPVKPSKRQLASQLDYGAYIRCREQAEMQLRASRPVLYTNHSGFPFLTPDGARLARQADALLKARQSGCSTPPPAPTQSPQPSRSER